MADDTARTGVLETPLRSPVATPLVENGGAGEEYDFDGNDLALCCVETCGKSRYG